MNVILIILYLLVLGVLSLYGLHRYWILYLYWHHYKKARPLREPPAPPVWPRVTVQLPLYNEYYVVERLIDAVCRLDYPRDRLEIQVLDDSLDESRALASRKVAEMKTAGFEIHDIHRHDRRGFKAGALANGLQTARGELIAIFDADFLPPADFLKRTVPYFSDEKIGMVQARWGHINADYSLLTHIQSVFLDGHFILEHTARNRSGAFFNFNGTAGVWRRETIDDAGGWSDDTLTEDLDISYRAQLKGWRFVFLPDLVCPAELPVDVGAFRSQQHRWAKGALQVARKLLPSVWRRPLPLRVKIESTAHLTANLGYCLMLFFCLLLLPSLIARKSLAWPALVNWIELAAFLSTTIPIVLFYGVAQRENSSGSRLGLRELPALLAFGAGMCLNNSKAVMEALLDIRTDFRRTAKFDIRTAGERWKDKRYRSTGRFNGLVEVLAAAYFVVAFLWCLAADRWWSLPFIAVFFCGFSYVGILTLAHNTRRA